ncbi:MAG: SUMF1/EgtB/PvdO family nonheme iron enzyme [Methylobacter sp.]
MRNLFKPQNVCAKFSVAVILSFTSFTTLAISWDEKLYNPKPAEGDVILPMPCGGALTFRKIETEEKEGKEGGPLSDQIVRLGDANSAFSYAENSIEMPIAGAFKGDKPHTRYFLLGKYELTQLQYQTITEPSCPTINDKSNLPQAQLNWFDAVDFANKYSLWLLKNAPELLPSYGDEKGFIRLPTETEWEFAARGGLAVANDASLFQASVFPMPKGSMNRYVWYSDPMNKGKAMPIGSIEYPNPAGLYDILGNLDEIVFDSFRMTLHSRLHGQIGAYIVRGGNFQLGPDRIHSSYRKEISYYKNGEISKRETTGLRLAIGGAAVIGKDTKELSSQWSSLQAIATEEGKVTPGAPAVESTAPAPVVDDSQSKQLISDLDNKLKQCQSATPSASITSCPELMPNLSAQSLPNPIAELSDLAEKANQPALKNRLYNLRADFQAIIEARNQKRDQAARETLRTAALICLKMHDDYIEVIRRYENILKLDKCINNFNDKDCRTSKERLEQINGKVFFTKQSYANTVMNLVQNYPLDVLETQKNFLLDDLQRNAHTDFIFFVKQFYEHAKRFHENNKIATDDWYESCKKVELQ